MLRRLKFNQVGKRLQSHATWLNQHKTPVCSQFPIKWNLTLLTGSRLIQNFSNNSTRFFSTYVNESEYLKSVGLKSTETLHQEKRQLLHKKFKVFLSKVHPDLFLSISEEYKTLNEESVQKLTALFDAIWTFISKQDPTPFHELPSPLQVKFVCKISSKEFRLLKTSFVLPISILTKEEHSQAVRLLWNYYEQCVEQLEKEWLDITSRRK
jgi:hypothetical protein